METPTIKVTETPTATAKFFPSMRLLVGILGCLGLALQYGQRMNLTMGIMCMVNKTAISIMDQQTRTPAFIPPAILPQLAPIDHEGLAISGVKEVTVTPLQLTTSSGSLRQRERKKFKDGPFNWPKNIQGRVLSAYFFGYIAFQAMGGVYAYKYGPYRVLILAMIFGTITTFLTPPIAKLSYIGVLILRFLTGLSAGMVWPALVELVARWTPKVEKSTMTAIINSGAQIGPIVSMPTYGALCAATLWGGWPLVFYSSGLAGLIWCAVFCILVTSDPTKNRFVSTVEKDYLRRVVEVKGVETQKTKSKGMKVPFKEIFTCIPCWAMFATHFFKAFGFYTILTNISTFNEEILGLDLKMSGILTAVPYVCFLICTILSGRAADYIIQKNWMEPTTCRKFFTALGSFGPAVTVFALGFTSAKVAWLGILLISLTLAFLGLNSGGGMYVIAVDMAPKFAGIIWGISNTFGTAPGIIIPLIIGALTKNRLIREWRVVFTICAVSYIISGLVFVLFASGKPQPWARMDESLSDEAKQEETKLMV